jgi:U3 small nucleolar RNA-associated protein 19
MIMTEVLEEDGRNQKFRLSADFCATSETQISDVTAIHTLYSMAKDPITRIQLLEKHLTKKTDSFNPNPLLELVALSRNEKPEVVHSAIWALHRVFIKLVGDGRLGRAIFRESDGEDEKIDLDGEGGAVRDWMMKRLREYVDVLGGLLRDSEEALRVGHSRT